MKIAIKNIAKENLDKIPNPCKACLYWEYPEHFKPVTELSPENVKEFAEKKATWFAQVLEKFGNCGKIVFARDKPVGYAQYASPKYFPQIKEYGAKNVGSAEEGVVFISCLYLTDEAFRGKQIGIQILNDIIEDLKQRGFKAIETFARADSSNNPSGPLQFYLKQGFEVKEKLETPGYFLVRLNL